MLSFFFLDTCICFVHKVFYYKLHWHLRSCVSARSVGRFSCDSAALMSCLISRVQIILFFLFVCLLYQGSSLLFIQLFSTLLRLVYFVEYPVPVNPFTLTPFQTSGPQSSPIDSQSQFFFTGGHISVVVLTVWWQDSSWSGVLKPVNTVMIRCAKVGGKSSLNRLGLSRKEPHSISMSFILSAVLINKAITEIYNLY